MAKNSNKYQYETSPRKLEPEYTPKPKKKVSTNKIKKKNISTKNKKQSKQKQKQQKTIKYLVLGFSIVFAIAYRNSKIDEQFTKVQDLKDELSNIEKQNVQLEIAIENATNLNNLEQQAKELLGMQKLSNKQTVYVSFPKEDYLEVASEKVIIEENDSIFQKIKNWFTNL